MLRVLDGIVLTVLFFVIVFTILLILGLRDRIEKLKQDLSRTNQRISDLNRRLKWMREK